MNPQLTCSQRQWLHSSVGKASHRYREVTGSNPDEVLNFFQASLRNYINCVHCDDQFFIFIKSYCWPNMEIILSYSTDDVKSAAQVADYWTVNREILGKRVSCLDSESKMAEQSAKHSTRLTAKCCLKSYQEQQEHTSTDDICYSEYICRPEKTFIP